MNYVINKDDLNERQIKELEFLCKKENIEYGEGTLEQVLVETELEDMTRWYPHDVSDKAKKKLVENTIYSLGLGEVQETIRKELELVNITKDAMAGGAVDIIKSMISCIQLNDMDYLERGNYSVYWDGELEDVYYKEDEGEEGTYLNIEVVKEAMNG